MFRPGDRVLQLRNDCDREIFNGALGTVQAVELVERELWLLLHEGWEVGSPLAGLIALIHASAISRHKAQGAEFPAMVIPLLTSHAAMLGRTLLYTMLTRVRQLVVRVGQLKALRLAVRDWRRIPRHTALGGLLTGTVQFAWPPASRGGDSDDRADDLGAWEGLLTDGGKGC